MSFRERLATIYRIVLPGIILQSVLIGGGFATGREIVEYGGKYGSQGWLSGLTIFLGFTVMSMLSFEACRAWQVFDYRNLMKRLVGKGWFTYELIYVPLAILTIAVMASAAGEILHETIDLSVWVGTGLIVLIVASLMFKGDAFIAKMKTIGTVALIGSYTVFGLLVWNDRSDQVWAAFAQQLSTDTPVYMVIWTGILYVGYNLGVYPASFFAISELRSRKESLLAAVFSGVLMAIPWFLTYIAIMGFYPAADVLQAPVPWLRMLASYDNVVVVVFGLVIGWTLVETATGVTHAFIGRLKTHWIERGKVLQPWQQSAIALIALLLAIVLSQVGIIDLIAKGYSTMAYGMILVFALPLLFYARKIFFPKH